MDFVDSGPSPQVEETATAASMIPVGSEWTDVRRLDSIAVDNHLRLATLGPPLTSSDFASRYFSALLRSKYGLSAEVSVYSSFEAAAAAVLDGSASALVVANAYSGVNTFYMDASFTLAAVFIHPTPPYGLATLKEVPTTLADQRLPQPTDSFSKLTEDLANAHDLCPQPKSDFTQPSYDFAQPTGGRRIAVHPACVPLLQEMAPRHRYPGYEPLLVSSTSAAAQMVRRRKVELALTNAEAVQEFGLRFVSHTRRIQMVWSLFVRARAARDHSPSGNGFASSPQH